MDQQFESKQGSQAFFTFSQSQLFTRFRLRQPRLRQTRRRVPPTLKAGSSIFGLAIGL
jgi:hypothetical protein